MEEILKYQSKAYIFKCQYPTSNSCINKVEIFETPPHGLIQATEIKNLKIKKNNIILINNKIVVAIRKGKKSKKKKKISDKNRKRTQRQF